MERFATHFNPKSGDFPMPDWEVIAKMVEDQVPCSEHQELWKALASQWVQAIGRCCPNSYRVYNSENFVLLVEAPENKAVVVLEFLERCLNKVGRLLADFTLSQPLGKCPVLVFSDATQYYHYLSHYENSEEDSGASGGVYLNHGYGHFALPSPDLTHYVSVMSHELSHAMLSHLALPLWLDEAITAEVEQSIAGSNEYFLDHEWVERHRDYWTESRIQDFWQGRSFRFADEGQELSYHLCRFVLFGLRGGGLTPDEELQEFILKASYEDAGQSASQDCMELDLGDALVGLLGEGDWTPHPEHWMDRISST